MQNNMPKNSSLSIFCIFCILLYAEYAEYAVICCWHILHIEHIPTYFLAYSGIFSCFFYIFSSIFCIFSGIFLHILSHIQHIVWHIFLHIFFHISTYFLAYFVAYICKIWWIFRPDRSVPGVRVGFIEFSNEARNRKPFRKHMHRAPAHSERILEVTPAAGTALEAAPAPSPVPEPFSAIQAFHPSLRSLAACSSRCSALTSSRLVSQQSSGSSILSLNSSACDLEEKGRNQKRSSMNDWKPWPINGISLTSVPFFLSLTQIFYKICKICKICKIWEHTRGACSRAAHRSPCHFLKPIWAWAYEG